MSDPERAVLMKTTPLYDALMQQIASVSAADLAMTSDKRIGAAALKARTNLINQIGPETGSVMGEILYVRNGFIHGWALNREDLEAKIKVRALVGGVCIATANADEPLPPFLLPRIPQGALAKAGFVLRAIPRRARTKMVKVEVGLEGSNESLSVPVDVFQSGARIKDTSFEGFAEPSHNAEISGWAWNSSSPEQSEDIVVLISGKAIARVTAHRYRGDLESAGIGSGHHAFFAHLDRKDLRRERRLIEYVIAKNGLQLPGSPMVIEGDKIFPTSKKRMIGNVIKYFGRPQNRA